MWAAVTAGNVTAWHYWQYMNPYEGQDTAKLPPRYRPGWKSPGIISIGGNYDEFYALPRYYVMKQWGRNVPKGSIRVDTVSDNPDLHVVAWRRPDSKLVIIAFNETTADIPATFNCSSIIGDIMHIRTADRENYVTKADIIPIANSFDEVIIGQSINTFIVPIPHVSVPELRFPAIFCILALFTILLALTWVQART
ncbi:MAG: hypothetical protein A2161_17445 [Candidatus Schekmanbacteria bacterium RBG_13_48_7]|uniref:Glycosyl hydrolase family 30 beta sandwich domain-containing protein n=1 Tax=Candidatus Schekmanbacteria bacterium RBG_13_48_7 TaxID=1817878 RepID=A0A1F7S3Y9_9BACT|nr:MAG: hypothetical protein A2161_17445 [Candidatus Schekmanbacteria bacterium RBG_13_48_7]